MTTALPVPTTLAELLDVEPIDRDLFRGFNAVGDGQRLFGGQVAAQALRAAGLTVEPDRLPHSFHGYFLRPGRPELPVLLQVDRDRDGGSLSARHVRALQDGQVIFSMLASFARDRPGPSYDALPAADHAVPAPDADVRNRLLLDVVEVNAMTVDGTRVAFADVLWVRVPDPLPDDRLVRACALAYISDLGTGFGQVEAEGVGTGGSSIDHAVWIRGDLDPNDWLLIDLRPGAAAGSLGVYTGSLRDRRGRLGAFIAQDQLLRVHTEEEAAQFAAIAEERRRTAAG